jgi:protein involved in polysaccharide export with SLBB domain
MSRKLKEINMRMLAFIGTFLLLSACSSIGDGVEVFKVSDLGKEGLPKFSESGSVKGTKPVPRDDEQYVIKPGDKLSIKFFFNPELNEQDLIVRPDGRISLQLIHEVEAASLTAPQLTHLLEKRYAGQLENPEIAVIVRSVREHNNVYVDGQVKSPGVFEIVGSLSVLQAVALANGFLADTAKKDEVTVIRRDRSGHPFVIKLDITAALSGEDLSQNIQLLPHDFVHVPRSFW